jgi:hypothetical protein
MPSSTPSKKGGNDLQLWHSKLSLSLSLSLSLALSLSLSFSFSLSIFLSSVNDKTRFLLSEAQPKNALVNPPPKKGGNDL